MSNLMPERWRDVEELTYVLHNLLRIATKTERGKPILITLAMINDLCDIIKQARHAERLENEEH